jgi:hypothetical protein
MIKRRTLLRPFYPIKTHTNRTWGGRGQAGGGLGGGLGVGPGGVEVRLRG